MTDSAHHHALGAADRLAGRRGSPSAIAGAFGRIATNVAVVTVADDSGLHGCTANVWGEPGEPPLLIVTLRRGGDTQLRISAIRRFAANLLADGQAQLARDFAGPGDRFSGATHVLGPELGQPLLTGALATLECELEAEYPFGTYNILVGRALAASHSGLASPLLFFAGDLLGSAAERQ